MKKLYSEISRYDLPDWLVVDQYELDCVWEEGVTPFFKKNQWQNVAFSSFFLVFLLTN